jgi:hypothetical protein
MTEFYGPCGSATGITEEQINLSAVYICRRSRYYLHSCEFEGPVESQWSLLIFIIFTFTL